MREVTDELRHVILKLVSNDGWSKFELLLDIWLKDLHLLMESENDLKLLYRHQGSIETIRNILDINKYLEDDEVEDGEEER